MAISSSTRQRLTDLRQRAARLARVALTPLPTPVQRCDRLRRAIGHKGELFMKREDVMTAAFAGNKIRKLEFTLGRVREQGYTCVVHGLGAQSNYCRQAAGACAQVGIPCYLVLPADHKAEDPAQGNRLLSYLFGARITMVEPHTQEPAKLELVERLKARGHKPYLIGYDDEVLGAIAYSLALAELLEQLAECDAVPDALFLAGRGGTHAGLELGKRLLGWQGEVYGFDSTPTFDENEARNITASIARDAAALLGLDETFDAGQINHTTAYSAPAYGEPSPQGIEAIKLVARHEGVILGPIYTAKAMWGMTEMMRRGMIDPNATAVFMHTGGTPEVFAYNTEIAATGLLVDDPLPPRLERGTTPEPSS